MAKPEPATPHINMLKGISPLLTPELLKVLMEMGHDDALVLADANFTATRIAAGKPVLRLPGTAMLSAVQAINATVWESDC